MTAGLFTGEIHPLADEDHYPYLPDDELLSLAEHIAENGLAHPLTLDAHGRLIDGKNRLRACDLAGVEPTFVRRDDITTDAEVAVFIRGENDKRIHRTPGQVAMTTAINLAAEGKRRNGRWARGSVVANGKLSITSDEVKALTKAGLVLDWRPDLATDVAAVMEDLLESFGESRRKKWLEIGSTAW